MGKEKLVINYSPTVLEGVSDSDGEISVSKVPCM